MKADYALNLLSQSFPGSGVFGSEEKSEEIDAEKALIR